MVLSFILLALNIWFVVVHGSRVEGSLDERACIVPANGLQNGGFERGSLGKVFLFRFPQYRVQCKELTFSYSKGAWNFTKIYDGPPGSPFSCSVVNVGFKSAHSVQMQGVCPPNSAGNGGQIRQKLPICKKVLYKLSWSIFQVNGGTQTAGGSPYLVVMVYEPNSVSPNFLARFDFDKAYYNYTTYEPGAPHGKRPAGQWATYSVPFPFKHVGNWLVEFQLFTVGTNAGNTAADIRIDDIVAAPA